MITVLKKNHDEILVLSSKNENVDIVKVKDVVNTIRRINNGQEGPLNIVVRSIENLNFTIDAKRYFDKITGWGKKWNGQTLLIN